MAAKQVPLSNLDPQTRHGLRYITTYVFHRGMSQNGIVDIIPARLFRAPQRHNYGVLSESSFFDYCNTFTLPSLSLDISMELGEGW